MRLAGLAVWAAACLGAPAGPAGEGSAAAPAGFAQALSPLVFSFPGDHGPHPAFRQEWWYLTGNLDAETGERFGFELTFFRLALEPAAQPDAARPAAAATSAAAPLSAWRARQIYMAHFAVTDVGAGRFRFAQKLSRDALGLAGAQSTPLRVWIDDWALEEAPVGAAGAAAAPGWRLHAAQDGYQLELGLQPLTPPVPNGERGLSRKSAEPGNATYYYSIPRLAVQGRLIREGHPLTVRGLAWLDREWGSGALGARLAGWDWFALQLDDGATLMFYALRNRDGTRDPYSAGTWIDPSGAARPLADAGVAIDVGDHWTDAHGSRYPALWHIRVPALALEVTVRPVITDQEIRSTPTYWEGAVDVGGTRAGRSIAGRGYVELVGYASERSSARESGAAAHLDR
ncbi:MAG TPA: lipocalin-like domain-containing protein [Steroidobacteraceae bacterium]|nr:lipocalin-like domain-containing protein [Steroidobacteraceae bacterium]